MMGIIGSTHWCFWLKNGIFSILLEAYSSKFNIKGLIFFNFSHAKLLDLINNFTSSNYSASNLQDIPLIHFLYNDQYFNFVCD